MKLFLISVTGLHSVSQKTKEDYRLTSDIGFRGTCLVMDRL